MTLGAPFRGRFRVERTLGVGGMGRVYLAFDRRLGRTVALKLPRASEGPQNWQARARALREAQALARVDHPGVVRLLDLCIEDGQACLVLDALAGPSLRGQVLPWRSASAVFAQVADALVAVHAAGLVHRDVSPDNILVGPEGRATLIDFGLARPWQTRAADDDFLALHLSPPDAAAGTPSFMAPEQRRGGPTDPLADQYGLCATLLSCLAVQVPGGATGAPEEVDPALLRVIKRGLAEPAARFPDMRALARSLAHLASRP